LRGCGARRGRAHAPPSPAAGARAVRARRGEQRSSAARQRSRRRARRWWCQQREGVRVPPVV
jgi:hypothetical protein